MIVPFLRERSGRWSPVKIVAFVAAILPAFWIAYQAAAGELGARPVTEAIHQAGDWALRFLLITLAISPAQRVLNYPRIVLARRTLGVASAAYALLHLSLYALDQHFDLFKVASEIVLRIYLLIGAVALTGLIALASTSTDAAIRRLGSQRWSKLHRVVYGIALLAIVHYFIQSKLETYQPVLMAGFLTWLLAYRALHRRNGEVTPLHLLFLAGGCGRVHRARRSRALHVHERRRRAARAARPLRHRHGRAAGLVGARRRTCRRRHRLLAAETRASAAERPGDLAGRHVGCDPGPIRQLMAEPGGLPLGVAAGVALALLRGRGELDTRP